MNSVILGNQIRKSVLELCHKKKASHIGGAFSIADVLAVLYSNVMNVKVDNPDWPERDRLFYSKGHACTALYAVLHEKGFFKELNLFEDYTSDNSYFTSHVNHKLPGIELSTGSLGHALGVACGVALAAKRQNKKYHIYTIVSDGELDEGSNWEAILFAPHHKLNNMTLIVDYNKIQSFGRIEEILALEPLKDKFEAFQWNVIDIDGHDHQAIKNACDIKFDNLKPKVIIAHTVKGKGVSFMENELLWHYRSPSDEEYIKAQGELEVNNA
ncbi:transketolase [Photorhabdus viridis]|uniref:transketolase n=1 Tax=Photorhabdus viridis TaxID=3163327 RepID=UPI003307A083